MQRNIYFGHLLCEQISLYELNLLQFSYIATSFRVYQSLEWSLHDSLSFVNYLEWLPRLLLRFVPEARDASSLANYVNITIEEDEAIEHPYYDYSQSHEDNQARRFWKFPITFGMPEYAFFVPVFLVFPLLVSFDYRTIEMLLLIVSSLFWEKNFTILSTYVCKWFFPLAL